MDDLELRLRALEAGMDVQAQILTSIQAELIEADRLASSVDRLGVGASELGQALMHVDRQQQEMSRLGQQLEDVAASAVTQEELSAQEDRKRADWQARRQRTRRRVALAAATIAVIVSLIAGAYARYEADNKATMAKVCDYRNAQTALIVDILRGSMRNVPADSTDPRVLQMRDNIAKFEALIVDCDQLR